jgi:single-strand DNA-binding protein
VNKAILTGRLVRDPDLRRLASGKAVCAFSLATNTFLGNGREQTEFHSVIAWDRLAEVCAEFLGKGQMAAIEGRIQTRSWDSPEGVRHWKTEVIATRVELLSGRQRRSFEATSAAEGLPADEPEEAVAIA